MSPGQIEYLDDIDSSRKEFCYKIARMEKLGINTDKLILQNVILYFLIRMIDYYFNGVDESGDNFCEAEDAYWYLNAANYILGTTYYVEL